MVNNGFFAAINLKPADQNDQLHRTARGLGTVTVATSLLKGTELINEGPRHRSSRKGSLLMKYNAAKLINRRKESIQRIAVHEQTEYDYIMPIR